MKFLALTFALLAFAIAPASAATIDLTPLASTAIELVNAVLVPLVIFGITLLAKKLKLDRIVADAAMNKMLHEGIQRGVDALVASARERASDGIKVEVSSDAVASVSNRMIEFSPDLLKRLGVTEEMLKKLVAEKLAATAA